MRKTEPGLWLGILSAAVLAVDAGLSPASRTWQAMACMALLTALGLAGWRLATLLLPGEGLLTRITAAFSLAMALGTVSATVLGCLGLLTPRLFELLAGCGAVLSRLAPRPEPGGEPLRRPAILPLLSLSLSAAFTCSQMMAYADSPPGTLSYDDLSYHLPAVATWLHSHDLRMMKPTYGDQGTTFYPIGSELWSWILVAPFRDSDVLARWSQLPFALFSLVAVAAVARRLGLSGPTTALAVVFYGSLPRTVELGLTAGSDHSLAFFMIAGVDAALLLAERQDGRRAVHAGVVLGLLLATKYIAVLFAPLLVLVWLAARWGARREARSLGLAAAVGLVLAVAVVTGGYTYIRSAVVTGNPLFPAPVELFGQRLLPGWPEASPSARRAGESGSDLWPLLWGRTDLLGPLFRFTVLPGALAAAVLALRRWRAPGGRSALAVALLPFGILVVFLYLHDHRDIRYFLAALALAGVAIGHALEQLRPALRTRLAGLLSLAFAVSAVVMATRPWTAALVALAALAIVLAAGWLRDRRRAGWLVAAASVLLAFGLGALIPGYERRRLEPSPPAAFLDLATAGGSTVVAYSGGNLPYFFFGRRLQNRVEIVPTRGAVEDRTFDWQGSPRFPYQGGRFTAWRRNLCQLGVDFIVFEQAWKPGAELRWMAAHPDLFRPLFQQGRFGIWSLESGACGTPAVD